MEITINIKNPTQEVIELLPNIQRDIDSTFKNFNDFVEQLEERKRQEVDQKMKEIIQIQEWTGMRVVSVLFDSNINNWKQFTSIFGQRIINKSNLVFIIEDFNGNRFGGFINAPITNSKKWIKDPNSFFFSLKSYGRPNGMFAFENKQPQNAFYFWDDSDEYLFAFGDIICIYKQNVPRKSFCGHFLTTFNGLCTEGTDKQLFVPARITVLQIM